MKYNIILALALFILAGAVSISALNVDIPISANYSLANVNNSQFLRSYAPDFFVYRNDWTTHNNYPSDCSAGEYATGIGDTLTCSTPSGGSGDGGWMPNNATENNNFNTTGNLTTANMYATGKLGVGVNPKTLANYTYFSVQKTGSGGLSQDFALTYLYQTLTSSGGSSNKVYNLKNQLDVNFGSGTWSTQAEAMYNFVPWWDGAIFGINGLTNIVQLGANDALISSAYGIANTVQFYPGRSPTLSGATVAGGSFAFNGYPSGNINSITNTITRLAALVTLGNLYGLNLSTTTIDNPVSGLLIKTFGNDSHTNISAVAGIYLEKQRAGRQRNSGIFLSGNGSGADINFNGLRQIYDNGTALILDATKGNSYFITNVTAPYFIGDGSLLTNVAGGMDYTNIAMTNKSNTFAESQTFQNNISVTNTVTAKVVNATDGVYASWFRESGESFNIDTSSITGALDISATGTIQGVTLTDGDCTITGGVLTSCDGAISQFTNDVPYASEAYVGGAIAAYSESDPIYSFDAANTMSVNAFTFVSSDPEAFGMLNITQARFLEIVRGSCTKQYAGAMWHYYDSVKNNYVYFKPIECQFYKRTYDAIADEIIFKPTTKIMDGKLCYNSNVKYVWKYDTYKNITYKQEVPILPFTLPMNKIVNESGSVVIR